MKVTVKGLASRTTLGVNDRDFRKGGRPTLTATRRPSAATGTVTFRDGTKVLATVKVSQGQGRPRAPVLARGTHR